MTLGRGVPWDMDGVLMDTGEFHYQSWAEVMPDFGVPFSRQFFQDTFGMNNAGILSILLGDKLTPKMLAEIGDRKEEAFARPFRAASDHCLACLTGLSKYLSWDVYYHRGSGA
jgi:beta-phosphoglucomutase-like phosphatase (HAD superfamily)